MKRNPALVTYPFPLGEGRAAVLRLPLRLTREDVVRIEAMLMTLVVQPAEAPPHPKGESTP